MQAPVGVRFLHRRRYVAMPGPENSERAGKGAKREIANAPHPILWHATEKGGRSKAEKGGRSEEVAANHAGRALWAIATVLLVGTLLDFGILWLGQRQPTLVWEYAAIVNTIEGMAGLILATGLAYAAFHFSGGTSLLVLRLLASSMVTVGIVGGILGALLLLDYIALQNGMQPEARLMLRTATIKGVTLSGLYLFVLVPVGLLGWVRRRDKR